MSNWPIKLLRYSWLLVSYDLLKHFFLKKIEIIGFGLSADKGSKKYFDNDNYRQNDNLPKNVTIIVVVSESMRYSKPLIKRQLTERLYNV